MLNGHRRAGSSASVLAALASVATIVLLSAQSVRAGLDAAERARLLAADRVGAGVVEALESTAGVRVIAVFALAGDGRPADLALADRRAAIASARATVLSRLAPGDFVLRRSFESINAVAGDATAAGVLALAADPSVVRVDVDEGGRGSLYEALPLMNVDDVKSLGFTGVGVTVAILDSGCDTDHPDLSDDLIDERCFCSGGGGCCPGGTATQGGPGAAEDDQGHGTNVAGIVTSKGTIAPEGGAPDAKIVAIKVLDSSNGFCCTSDVVAGLDYVINDRPDVDVVNMSLGTFATFAGACDGATAFTMAFATAIDTLRANGVTTFASSGNGGSPTEMTAPACVANALSVGAVWDSNLGSQTFLGCTDVTTAADEPTCFSNSNATTDLFAPGAYTLSTGLGGSTSSFGGTSQASPAAAACAADLLEADEGLTPGDVETALKASSTIVVDPKNGLSFPRVDCLEALGTIDRCGTSPVAGCRGGLKSSLALRKAPVASKDTIKWKIVKGDEIASADLGDPASSTGYTLCVYDENGGTPALAGSLRVDAGDGWQDKTPRGWLYKSSAGLEDGVRVLKLKTGAQGKAKIQLKAKRSNGLWPAPIAGGLFFHQDAKVTVQLFSDDAPACWSMQFTAAKTARNDGTQFKAKAP